MTHFSHQPPVPRKSRVHPVYPALVGVGLLAIVGCNRTDTNVVPEHPAGTVAPAFTPVSSASVSQPILSDAGDDVADSNPASTAQAAVPAVQDAAVRDAGRRRVLPPRPAGGMPSPHVSSNGLDF